MKHARRERPEKTLTRPRLQRMAVQYLQRFPASNQRFRQVMERKIKRAHQRCPGRLSDYPGWLDEVESYCERAGLLDDESLAGGIARSSHERGHSLRGIRDRLRRKGFTSETAELAIEAMVRDQADDTEYGPDFVAALRYAKRKKIGPFGEPDVPWEQRRKHLASLARRGFSYEVARSVLELPKEAVDDLLTPP